MQEENDIEKLGLSEDEAKIPREFLDINSLTKAIKEGKIEKVIEFLNLGVDVNGVDDKLFTPLLMAVSHNFDEIAKLLLERGANINHPSHDAIIFRAHLNIPMMELLLSYDENLVNEEDERGLNLLQHAANNLDFETVKWLVDEKGLQINGLNLCHHMMEDYMENNQDDENGLKLLDMLKFLDARGINFSELGDAAADYGGLMPVHVAAMYCPPAILEYFLNKGLNINDKSAPHGNSLLHVAVETNLEVTDYLISKGADLNIKNNYNQSPIDLLDDRNSLHMSAKLIIAGADLANVIADLVEEEDDILEDCSLPEKVVVLGNMLFATYNEYLYSKFLLNIRFLQQEITEDSFREKHQLGLCEEMKSLISKIKINESTKEDVENLEKVIDESISLIEENHNHNLDVVSYGRRMDRSITENIFSYLENDEIDDVIESVIPNVPEKIKADVLEKSFLQDLRTDETRLEKIADDITSSSNKKPKINPEDLLDVNDQFKALAELISKCGLAVTAEMFSKTLKCYIDEVKNFTNDYTRTETTPDLTKSSEVSCLGDESPQA